jgi:outer membrane protein assembly factor BamB
MTNRWPLPLLAALLCVANAPAADWLHWRGPQQNGYSADKNLPDYFEVTEVGKNNLIWKQPYGGRSAPLVWHGKLFTISGYDMSKPTEGERIMAFDAATGKVLWEKRFNVFHTDIVSSRLGWTTLAADPETGTVYAHTTGGFLFALDPNTGKELWSHQLTEEYGRVTGYGGRIVSPVFDSGLVIIGTPTGGWGDQARGQGRFVAFDGKTGEVVWWSSPTEDLADRGVQLRGTYYSIPVVANIGGQRMLITGGADGAVHGLKVRTGERLWSYHFATGVVNPSPIVDGNLVYISHGEENPEGGTIGRVSCLDASKVDPKTKTPKVVWENRKLAKRFGLASAALADGRLYAPDDASELVCFNAKTGKVLWKQKYGTISRGAPLIAGGKLYVFDVNAKLAVWELKGDKEPEELYDVTFRRESGVGFVETHGTPIAVNNRLYFLTQDNLYCVGKPDAMPGEPTPVKAQPETPFDAKAKPVDIRVYPCDLTAKPGETVALEVKFLDANGRVLPAPADAKLDWSLPKPPTPPTAPKGSAGPPALAAELKPEGPSTKVAVAKAPPSQAGKVAVKFGALTADARLRVPVGIPSKQDFEKVPVGGVPAGWVNTAGKYSVVELEGQKVFLKVNTDTRPPIARANAYFTMPDAANYSIQADMMGTEVAGKFGDMGLVNSRYTVILDGKSDSPNGKRQLRIVSWEARPRVNEAVEYDWQPNTWYTVKFSVEPKGKTGVAHAKIWKRGEPEPEKWLVSYEDPSPNLNGAAALYGYVPNATVSAPGSALYYDNVTLTPNK